MNLDVLIPQIWYDFIGRVIPGLSILGYCYLAIKSKSIDEILNLNASFVGAFIILMFSYLIGALIGGCWFLIEKKYRDKVFRGFEADELTNNTDPNSEIHKRKHIVSSLCKKAIEIRNKLLEDELIELIKATKADLISAKVEAPVADKLIANSRQMIPFIYDLIQVKLPKMGSRISKLRGEQLLCGNLILSFILLWIIPIIMIFTSTNVKIFFNIVLSLIALGIVILASVLKIHLKGRYKAAMNDGWLFLQSKITEDN